MTKCLWDVASLDSHSIRLWRQPLENSCLASFLVVNTSIAPNISVQYPVTVPVQSSATLSAAILSTEGVIITNNTQPYDGNSVQLAKAACCGGLLTHFIFPNTILNPTHLQYYQPISSTIQVWFHCLHFFVDSPGVTSQNAVALDAGKWSNLHYTSNDYAILWEHFV